MKVPLLFLWLLPVAAWPQARYDVIIDEIMADPSPVVSLPNYEWIELKNTSSRPVNLGGWRLGDRANTSAPFPSFLLQPDSLVLVCPAAALASLSILGPAIAVAGFPSLDNNGDELYLEDSSRTIIHAVRYAKDWYRNPVKEGGGWSLEMIDTRNACGGSGNWTASTDPVGGTPARKNAADGFYADEEGPSLLRGYAENDTSLVFLFDEPLDAISGSDPDHFHFNPSIAIHSVQLLPPVFDRVVLNTQKPEAGTVYTLTVESVTDCKGNQVGNQTQARIGIPKIAVAGDMVINEVLFNPVSGGSDYVELYNRSKGIIDAGQLYIANRNSTGGIASARKVSEYPYYLFPGDFLVITEDSIWLTLDYLVKFNRAVLEIASLPSYPDDEGTVVLTNFQADVVDEVHYNRDWHFPLLSDVEGVALERLDPDGPSQEGGNWHSAAASAGFGTPGYANSQSLLPYTNEPGIVISPTIFSPDNDGRDDFASIFYEVNGAGFVANVTIFNDEGIPVRNLVQNQTIGNAGRWTWDGLGNHRNPLPPGIYVVYVELFNLQGEKQRSRKVVVLARSFL